MYDDLKCKTENLQMTNPEDNQPEIACLLSLSSSIKYLSSVKKDKKCYLPLKKRSIVRTNKNK